MNPSIKRIRGSDGAGNASVMTVQADRAALATTIIVDTVLNVPDEFIGTWGTPHTFNDPITGEEITVISEASAVDFRGRVDGGNIEIDQVAPGYTDNGNSVGDIIIIKPTTEWSNNIADVLDVSMNDDGTLKAVVDNPGWTDLPVQPTTVTPLGNRSYEALFEDVDLTQTISPGMRLRTTRTVTAPTQCTSLNGTNQYYSRSSANLGSTMTFTDDFTLMAWVKLSAYTSGDQDIIGRGPMSNGGFALHIDSSGRPYIQGVNSTPASRKYRAYQSIPLNKWVHIAAALDMSTATGLIFIDGISVATESFGGTATSLTQAGNLWVGNRDSGTTYFNGKIAQAAIFSSILSQATIRGYMSQGLTGSEPNLISAYSFNNSINDLNTTNANNLTAQGSAVATNADSPFSTNSFGTATGTTDYAIVTKAAFSTNTTLTVQVPEGCTIPTSGGVSAVAYSTQKAPYGMPIEVGRWRINSLLRVTTQTTSNATYGSFASGGWKLTVPIGSWNVGWRADAISASTTPVYFNLSPTTSIVGTSNTGGYDISPLSAEIRSSAAANYAVTIAANLPLATTTVTNFIMYTLGATTAVSVVASVALAEAYAEFGLL